jgi:hypothetical protein
LARIVFFIGSFQGSQRENYYSLLRCNHGIFASGNRPPRYAFSQKGKSIFEKEISSFCAAEDHPLGGASETLPGHVMGPMRELKKL